MKLSLAKKKRRSLKPKVTSRKEYYVAQLPQPEGLDYILYGAGAMSKARALQSQRDAINIGDKGWYWSKVTKYFNLDYSGQWVLIRKTIKINKWGEVAL